jgi:hypothetical protein
MDTAAGSREATMGFLVCYDDFTYEVVSDHELENLLESGSIIGYDPAGDWELRVELPPAGPDVTGAKPAGNSAKACRL